LNKYCPKENDLKQHILILEKLKRINKINKNTGIDILNIKNLILD